MSTKTTAFNRENTEISVDFSAEGVSSHGAVVLLGKFEGTHKVIGHMAGFIPERLDPACFVPVLRPGNSHLGRWYVGILKLVVWAIRGDS